MQAPTRAALMALAVLATGACAGAAMGGVRAPVEQTEFAARLGVDLERMTRTASGLYLRDTSPGSGAEARRGSLIRVHYVGWLPDGTQVDANVAPEAPLEFRLGEGNVIRGWEEGIVGMRAGGQRQLVVPARLAYGGRRVGAIPPDSHLVFLIELRAVR